MVQYSTIVQILSVVTWLVVNLHCEFPWKDIDRQVLPQAVISEDSWVYPYVYMLNMYFFVSHSEP